MKTIPARKGQTFVGENYGNVNHFPINIPCRIFNSVIYNTVFFQRYYLPSLWMLKVIAVLSFN